jgi:hypothetical protein
VQDLFNTVKASFDEPMSMLIACHDRVRHFVGLIEKLAEHIFQQGVDQQVKEAIATVIRYFDIAAPLHHADEDESLFVVLHDTLHNTSLNHTIARLTAEHHVLESRWQEIKQQLTDIVAARGGRSLSFCQAVACRLVDCPRAAYAGASGRLTHVLSYALYFLKLKPLYTRGFSFIYYWFTTYSPS